MGPWRPLEVAVRAVVPLSLVLLLAGCAADAPPAAAPAPITGAPSQTAPSTAVSGGTPAASPAAAPTIARALYWLGTDDRRGPRLYRELVPRPAAADPVRDALTAVLESEPRDPDYRSLWAAGATVRGVTRDGTTAVVDLSREALASGGGSAFASASVQQLVHTATAADPSLRAVQLRVEGEPVADLWGAVDVSQPVRRAPAAEVLGPVWLDVEEGASLSGRFGGTATVFEATVSWQLRQGERVVQEGSSTASTGAPGRGEWSGELDAPPGDYELWAYESSAEDGSVTWPDTKRITLTG
ncbi:MAG: hypothetical protein JWM62_1841 [Frankiales bacterium]|nr:hypothetical protein [Frankiales bacterium]